MKQEFIESMAYLGLAYGKEFNEREISLYYDFLGNYTDEVLIKAIKSIIKKSKFLPKVNELADECEKYKDIARFEILDYMQRCGYFKSMSEYEKASKFLERDNVPDWLKRDINEYYRKMQQLKLDQKQAQVKMLNG